MSDWGEGKIKPNYVHSPIFVQEILDSVLTDTDQFFLDCTLGEGGHSEAVLNKFQNIQVTGLDRDVEILKVAQSRLSVFDNRFTGVNCNFTEASKIHSKSNDGYFDAALIDLGISVYHYKKSRRGFSFADTDKLDMRLDHLGISAHEIVNTYSESELTEIFYQYGEERFSKLIVRAICKQREKAEIDSAKDLADLVVQAIPKKFQKGKTHPATKIFQALRIKANNEFENIYQGIPEVLSVLKSKGRLGVITFHSLEDRIVKKIFQKMNKDCICPPQFPQCVCNHKKEVNLIGKAFKPREAEVNKNPSARSAKLRIVEKI
ncbi:MAG: 16S rRNA (cytosine(1402)-N(4))-methyltransferase RsmH [Spirochaetes bacterium]|nr:16S rRNA (cytosine(1402)-N(4))-methyltransferase RsmH [Spirochaetota bacterium]